MVGEAKRALAFKRHEQVRSNDTSGMPGVHFLKSDQQPQGIWQAIIKLPDGKKVRSTEPTGCEGALERI